MAKLGTGAKILGGVGLIGLAGAAVAYFCGKKKTNDEEVVEVEEYEETAEETDSEE